MSFLKGRYFLIAIWFLSKARKGWRKYFFTRMRHAFFSHKYNNLFETFFLVFSQWEITREANLGLLLCSYIHISVLCTVWMVCILRKSVLWIGWQNRGRNWSPQMSPAFCNIQKSASRIRPMEICLTVPTVCLCCLFLYLFQIHQLAPSPACKSKWKDKPFLNTE